MFKFYKKPFKSLFIISTMASSILLLSSCEIVIKKIFGFQDIENFDQEAYQKDDYPLKLYVNTDKLYVPENKNAMTEEFIQHVLSPAELERYNKQSADNKLTGSNVEDEEL